MTPPYKPRLPRSAPVGPDPLFDFPPLSAQFPGQAPTPDEMRYIARHHPGVDYDEASHQLGSEQPGPLGKWTFKPFDPQTAAWLRDQTFDLDSSTHQVATDGPGIRSMTDPITPQPSNSAPAQLRAAFRKIMSQDEGYRRDAYYDPQGILTVGIGHKVLPTDHLKFGDTIDDDRIERHFAADGAKALNAAQKQAMEAGISDPDFIARLGSVNYQLGTDFPRQFPKTWAYLKAGNYEAAAQEAANSHWFGQTPNRVISFQKALRALPAKDKPQK